MIEMQDLVYLITVMGAIVSIVVAIMKHRRLAVQVAGTFQILTGIIVTFGYIINVPEVYTFPRQGIGMALSTAINFILSGIAFIVLANEVKQK